jgi:diguanylate cyclase (GGDEF)-like protein
METDTQDARSLALHDPLTGLPNRALFVDRLDHAIERAHRFGGPVAMVFTDLDSFKSVNETYGRRVGDELLQAVAGRLRRILRATDTVARLVADEFVVLCEDLHHRVHLAPIAARVDAGLHDPFVLSTVEVEVSAIVGTAFSDGGDDLSGDFLEDADVAMSWMKRNGDVLHSVFDIRSRPPRSVMTIR